MILNHPDMLYNALIKKRKDLKDFWARQRNEEKNKLRENLRNDNAECNEQNLQSILKNNLKIFNNFRF